MKQNYDTGYLLRKKAFMGGSHTFLAGTNNVGPASIGMGREIAT